MKLLLDWRDRSSSAVVIVISGGLEQICVVLVGPAVPLVLQCDVLSLQPPPVDDHGGHPQLPRDSVRLTT